MNELKQIYEHYGVLGLAVAFIAYLLWQKRDFFLSKNEKKESDNEIDFPCCKRRKEEVEKLEKRIEFMDTKLSGHITEADGRVLNFAQFHSRQTEINENTKQFLAEQKEQTRDIFKLISEIKNMMIESNNRK